MRQMMLLRGHQNGFVLGRRSNVNVRDRVRFHGAGNQIVCLCHRVNKVRHSADFVHRRILQVFSVLQGLHGRIVSDIDHF
jgi:hypothetical protein